MNTVIAKMNICMDGQKARKKADVVCERPLSMSNLRKKFLSKKILLEKILSSKFVSRDLCFWYVLYTALPIYKYCCICCRHFITTDF